MEEEREVEAVVGQIPRARGNFIKKRALKNKALSVSFNDKDLRDYVTGFHKRKKKRRKEAQQHIQEKERLRRIENRKKRKQDREYVQFGDVRPANDAGPDESGDDLEQDEETEPSAPVSGMKTYDNGEMTITVTTSEISREEDENVREKTCLVPRSSETEKKHSIPVIKKKPMKTSGKRRSLPKPQKKRDRRMGKKKRKMN
ncbi:Nucleolar protein 12 [Macleaya cordata]|uniref:Nucleolar protein 12 n=1 Tax=Macleaya cordata TaxID=56857 RepID=A0A200QII5_MACCD|nr:Nucleolar protein 12 [Macleaya cordata]